MDNFKQILDNLKEKNLYRFLRNASQVSGTSITINNKILINFASNNYLGLADHPLVKKAAIEAVEKYGTGGTASRLVAGTFDIHYELEKKLAELKGKEKALVFPSGFQANIGVVSLLADEGSCIIMDKLNHASLWDAVKLSKARLFVYEHLDMLSLEKVLKRAKQYKNRLVITETLFSMDGDIAPLKDIVSLSKKYDADILVDEAHATGVFGKNGAGLAEHFDVENDVKYVMGTLSKALGSQGGFIAGSADFIDYLINKSRAFIYTTAVSPALAGAAIEAIDIIKKEPLKRENLIKKAKDFTALLKEKGFDTLNSQSQIMPVILKSEKKAVEFSKKLFDKGFYVPAVRPPTVPEGLCRLRVSLTSEHKQEDIDRFLEVLCE